MKSSHLAKIVYFPEIKEFSASNEGDTTEDMSEAYPYYEFDSDKSILNDFDDNCKGEVWKVKITVETVE